MNKTQNPLLSRKKEEKWPKKINTAIPDMGGSCTPNEQMNQISSRSRPSDKWGWGGGGKGRSSRPFGTQFGLKQGRVRAPLARSLDPPLQMRP